MLLEITFTQKRKIHIPIGKGQNKELYSCWNGKFDHIILRKNGRNREAPDQESGSSGFNPGIATNSLCDTGQVTWPLWALQSIPFDFLGVGWGLNEKQQNFPDQESEQLRGWIDQSDSLVDRVASQNVWFRGME